MCSYFLLTESATQKPIQPKSNEFNELEILQLVPVIIQQLKLGHVTEMEENTLSIIFGSLWEIIKEESLRSEDAEMNPVLAALLQSREIRLAKREINFQKITRNAVNLPSLPVADKFDVSPAQRILQKAAALIQRYYIDKTRKSKRNFRRRFKSSGRKQISVIPYQRSKRHLGTNVLDRETTVKLLALMTETNNKNTENSAKVIWTEENDNISVEEDNEPNALASTDDGLNNEDDYYDADIDNFARDEAYDDAEAGNEDYTVDDYRPRIIRDEFENPSITELIKLVAKHNERREVDENKLKTKMSNDLSLGASASALTGEKNTDFSYVDDTVYEDDYAETELVSDINKMQ